ncbi:MAG: hypothetical protein ACP5GX_09325 [Anaerolineae bacterium]
MRAYRKADIRRLATEAYELEARVVEGKLRYDENRECWMVGDTSLEEWGAKSAGKEITLILIPDEPDRPMEKRTCRTCGREYIGSSCPHCREVRFRLRGH